MNRGAAIDWYELGGDVHAQLKLKLKEASFGEFITQPMPILTVTTWPNLGDEKSQLLIERLTDVVHETTGAPLDTITVLIHEVPQSRWGEGGVLGNRPEFPVLSRCSHGGG